MQEKSAWEFQADFFTRHPLAETVLAFLDVLPQTYFYGSSGILVGETDTLANRWYQ